VQPDGEQIPGPDEPFRHAGDQDGHPTIVVVVAFGAEDQLAASLSFLGTGYPVVVVDNGLSDEARRICLELGATYLRPAANIGFAAAVNVALREHRPAGADVLLLNPDARLSPGDLATLSHGLHRMKGVAAAGPKLVNVDGSSQRSMWPVPSPVVAWAAVVGAADRLARRQFISGAVLLLCSDAVDSIGLFDERFFLYAEETDWQLRALRAGWTLQVVEGASAEHLGAGTSSSNARRELLFNASAERFVRKWYGSTGWQIFRVASLLTALRRLVTTRRGDDHATLQRALRGYLTGPDRAAETARGAG
jgi:GT2 family glycosyltransferase